MKTTLLNSMRDTPVFYDEGSITIPLYNLLAKIEVLGKLYSSETGLTMKTDSIKTVEANKEKQAIVIGITADYKPEFITLSDLKH